MFMSHRSIRTPLRRVGVLMGLLIAMPIAAHAACSGTNAVEALKTAKPDAYQSIAEAATDTVNGKGVFWQIDVPGRAPSYLFGTKHTVDPDVAANINGVQQAIRSARMLMVELSPAEQAEMAGAMQSDPAMIVDMSGGTIEDFLPPDMNADAARILGSYGIPYEAAKRMRPWFLQMLMALPPCAVAASSTNPELVMDNILAQTALDAGIAVEGLEQWEDQIDIFRTMSAHDEKAGLIWQIDTFAQKEDEYAALSELYDAREIALIWEFSRWLLLSGEYDFETTPEAAVAEMERVLLTDRNGLMFERSKAEVAAGGVVIAVGALHLVGESGLVAAYMREGYKVTRLD